MPLNNDFPVPKSFTKSWHSKPYPFISPTRPELSMSEKNVIITGGGTGIGLAIATAFAKAGAKSIAILGRRREPLEKAVTLISSLATATKVLYETADLSDRTHVDAAMTTIAHQVGKIDILVSNAGMLPLPGLLRGYDAETFMQSFQGNVLTTFNANSMLVPGLAPYAVSKAACLKMLEYLAAENPQLHVVSVQPGWVPTDINGYQAEAPDSVDLPGEFYV
ncbi:SDR family NAD(P)-dependent oxidoreductase [Aspergillus thermomutatus]|uniref:Uncharacterized protein n=1 Tax=Aspergillus thermomutatus TaxID=41047 RepID=A0A397GK11_ASPTH|nr:uncharacterized protein CDV56_103050 [Aspergillus thermomutatus]RHZ48370.1 hypothetical protein CDV56_103050 [Aspergillus thermomutatus]